jgi:Skp family chaperone for outer membrane proteins
MLFTLTTAFFAVGLAAVTAAQEKEAASLPVAVLNLDVLFKEDPKVVKALTELKQQAVEIDEKIKLRQAELESTAADANKAQPGSQEQRRLGQQAARLQNELQQFIARERASVQLQEARIYLATYRDVESIVQKYCREKGIKLVIRQQATGLDGEQSAQEILKALNRIVVFEEGLDITADIQERMKAKEKP